MMGQPSERAAPILVKTQVEAGCGIRGDRAVNGFNIEAIAST